MEDDLRIKQAPLDREEANRDKGVTEEVETGSEMLFRQLVMASPDGMARLDEQGRILFSSPQLKTLFAWSQNDESYLGQPVLRWIMPEDQAKAMTNIANAMRGVISPDNRYTLVREDGIHFTGEINAAPMLDPLGCPQGVIATFRDVSQHQQTEVNLLQKLRSLKTLPEIAVLLMKHRRTGDVLAQIIEQSTTLFCAPHGYLYMVTPDDKTLELKMARGRLQKYVGFRLAPGHGLAGKVWQSGAPLVVEDYASWPGRETSFPPSLATTTAGVPLWSNGEVIGVLGIAFDEQVSFDSSDLEILNQVAQIASLALENARAEEALRQSEKRFRELFNTANDAIFIHDLEGQMLEVNNVACEHFGYLRPELLRKDPLELNAVEYVSIVREHTARLSLSGPTLYETVHLRKGGSRIPTEVSARIIDFEGRQAVLSVARDITERKHTEEEIRQQLRELTAIYRSSRRLQKLTDLKTLAREIISTLEMNLEYRHGAVLLLDEHSGKLFPLALFDKDQGDDKLASMRAGLETEGIDLGKGIVGWVAQNGQSVCLPDVRQDPRYRDIRIGTRSELCVPLRFGDQFMGVINIESPETNAFDSSDLRLLEVVAAQIAVAIQNSRLLEEVQRELLERRKAEEALQESEAQYRTLFTEMGEGFALHEILYDHTGQAYDYRFLEVNPAFERQTGLSRDMILGRTAREVMPALESFSIEKYSRVVESGESIQFEQSTEALGKHYQVFAFRPRPGQFATLTLDISKRKELEQTMEKARTDFLFAVSHELKTPLYAMNAIQEILSDLPPATRAERFLEYGPVWQRNLLRLRHIIENLVDSQRPIEMGLKLVRVPASLGDLLHQALDELEPYAASRGTRFRTTIGEVPPFPLDTDSMTRMVENLLTNAIKFSPQQGEVQVTLEEDHGQAVILVRDQGMGIREDLVPLIFQPFFRAPEALRAGVQGTGLGLYVAKMIAEAHQGTIELTSESGQGTTMIVRLPIISGKGPE
jgi:PAS domain S-box-containing protein